MAQVAILTGKLQQLPAVWPNDGEPTGPERNGDGGVDDGEPNDLRSNYKSDLRVHLNLDFYWMLQQMFYQFAEPETALLVMGDDAQQFDADADYVYQPVSTNIETEQNKQKKLQNWQQIMNSIIGMKSPATPPIIAYIIGKMCECQARSTGKSKRCSTSLPRLPLTRATRRART